MTTQSITASSSESEATATQLHGRNPTPINLQNTSSFHEGGRTVSTAERSTIAETATIRSNSPAPSQASTVASGTQRDAASVATTATRTEYASTTAVGGNLTGLQHPLQRGVGTPMMRPPIMTQPPQPRVGVPVMQPPVLPPPPTGVPVMRPPIMPQPPTGVPVMRPPILPQPPTGVPVMRPPILPQPPTSVPVMRPPILPQPPPGVPVMRPPIMPQPPTGVPVMRPPILPQPPTGVPVMPPPIMPQPPQPSISTGASVVNQPIRVDVASAHQQYQQTTVQPEISPYSTSSATSATGTFSSPGSVHVPQQPHISVGQNLPNQTHVHRTETITQQTTTQPQYQQQLPPYLSNPFHGQQIVNNLLGPDAFQDVVLNIDYGAIEAYNVAVQSPEYLADVPMPTGIPTGGPRFDAAKAIFNQADINHDGRITREEFRQWAQGDARNFGHQSHTNYQTTTNYGQVIDAASPEVASILQQSGLGQGFTNFG